MRVGVVGTRLVLYSRGGADKDKDIDWCFAIVGIFIFVVLFERDKTALEHTKTSTRRVQR